MIKDVANIMTDSDKVGMLVVIILVMALAGLMILVNEFVDRVKLRIRRRKKRKANIEYGKAVNHENHKSRRQR